MRYTTCIMECYKKYEDIINIDKRHILLGQITGQMLTLRALHEYVSKIEMHSHVPERIIGQFDVARNMALYTLFCYSLAPEVQMKSYSVIEMALREYYKNDKKTAFKNLLRKAVDTGILQDKGFRNASNDDNNPYCKSLIDVLPSLRNESAHGTSLLNHDCVRHLEICADLVNQLFR